MTRKNTPPHDKVSTPTDALLERLIGVVADLSEQVNVLRIAIDDLREECSWAARQIIREDTYRPVMHITSMPKDPCAADFGERVNRYKPDDLPGKNETAEPQSASPQQDELW